MTRPTLSGELRLEEGDLTTAIVTALSDVVAYGRSRLASPNGDPVECVHEYRKSLRRARSLLRMLRPSVSKRVRRAIESPFRDAHHALAARRDHDSRLHVWVDFRQRHGLDIPAADALFGAPGPGIPKLPDKSRTDDAIALLSQRLPTVMTTDDLRRGLKSTYRSVREALAKVETVADPTHVHRLRRRVKDLRHQLELIAELSGKRARKRQKRASRIASDLGTVTDLYILRAGLDEVCRNEPIDPAHKREIDKAIDREIEATLAIAIDDCRQLTRKKPRTFAGQFGL